MMLLITSSPRADECKATLEASCGEQVECVGRLSSAISRLRQGEYSLVVIDQNITDPEPQAFDILTSHLGMALPVYVNFALNSTERIVREVQLARRRIELERAVAMRTATVALKNDLKTALTGILLSSELALSVPSLPEAAQAKIRSVCDLAESIRERLDEKK
jgi:signal transduction histidine kinase